MRKINLLLCILLISACTGAQTATPDPDITVRRLTLSSLANRLPLDAQQQIVQDIRSRIYKHAYLEEIAERVRYACQVRGFFKADVGRPSVTVVSQTPQKEIVDIAFSVNEGEQYRLKDISFTGEKAFSAEELRAEFHIVDGDIFNTAEIRQGLDALRKIYQGKGYVNFTPVPNTQVDDAAHTISLIIDTDEGAQFRIGRLVLDGPEPKPGAGAKLLENWKQYEGQIYDPRILERFLRDNAALLPPGVTLDNNLAITQDAHLHILIFRLDLPNTVD
jgi:outer membrane translocation and assembly module TamA